MKLSDAIDIPPRILLYGPFGGGKTAFIETLGADVQIADIDLGVKTGLYLKDPLQETRKQVDVEIIRSTDPLSGDNFSKAKDHLLKVATACAQGTYKFKAYAVDSLTTLSEAAVMAVMRAQGKAGKSPNQQEWGLAILEVSNYISILRSLPVVVLLTAHEQTKLIDGSDVIKILVFGKKLPDTIPAMFDEIYYCKPRLLAGGAIKHVLTTKSSPSIPVRSRYSITDGYDMSLGLRPLLKGVGFDVDTFKSPYELKQLKAASLPSETQKGGSPQFPIPTSVISTLPQTQQATSTNPQKV